MTGSYPGLVLLRVSRNAIPNMHDECLLLREVSGSGQTQPGFPHVRPTLEFHISHSSPLPFPGSAIPSAFCCPRPHHSKKLTKACSVVLPTSSSWQTWDLGDPGTKKSSFLKTPRLSLWQPAPALALGTHPILLKIKLKRIQRKTGLEAKDFRHLLPVFLLSGHSHQYLLCGLV